MPSVDAGNNRDLLRVIDDLRRRVDDLERRQRIATAGGFKIYGPNGPNHIRAELDTDTGLDIKDKNGIYSIIRQNATDGTLAYPWMGQGEIVPSERTRWFEHTSPTLNSSTTWVTIGTGYGIRFNEAVAVWLAVHNNTTVTMDFRIQVDINSTQLNGTSFSLDATYQYGSENRIILRLDLTNINTVYDEYRVRLQCKRNSGSGDPGGSVYYHADIMGASTP